MPGYKNKVWEKISNMHSQYEQDKGEQGLQAGRVARKRFMHKIKDEEEKKEREL